MAELVERAERVVDTGEHNQRPQGNTQRGYHNHCIREKRSRSRSMRRHTKICRLRETCSAVVRGGRREGRTGWP